MSVESRLISRRQFNCGVVAAATASTLASGAAAQEPEKFKLRYILGSSMYGTTPVAEILPEVNKCGAEAFDIWPRIHGNQREQVEEMGHDKFAELLKQNNTRLGISTRYDLGPFRIQDEIKFVNKLGGDMIVTGSGGPAGLKGKELRTAVANFVERMKPTIEVAEEYNVNIAIENHVNALLESVESFHYLVELSPSKRLGISLAPYHLPSDEQLLSQLILDIAPRLTHFYAWQHGQGASRKMPKSEEIKQLPGRGPLNFKPLLASLKQINFDGWTEVFMHPVPRGTLILEDVAACTAEIDRGRKYLEQCLAEL